MKTVTTAWVFNRPYIFLAEDKGLAYDSEISKDFHNVIRANSADDISIQHIKDMHFTNEELMSDRAASFLYGQSIRPYA